jgi:hypothetical protein
MTLNQMSGSPESSLQRFALQIAPVLQEENSVSMEYRQYAPSWHKSSQQTLWITRARRLFFPNSGERTTLDFLAAAASEGMTFYDVSLAGPLSNFRSGLSLLNFPKRAN